MPDVRLNDDFIGLNKGKPETNLAPNEASVAKNVRFSEQRIEKRRGSLRVNASVIPKSSLWFTGSSMFDAVIDYDDYENFDYVGGYQWTKEVAVVLPSGSDTGTHAIADRGPMATLDTAGWSWALNVDNKAVYYHEHGAGGTTYVTGTYEGLAYGRPIQLAAARSTETVYLYAGESNAMATIGNAAMADETQPEAHVTSTLHFGMTYNPGTTDTIYSQLKMSEFRSWKTEIGFDTLSAFALRELPTHMLQSSNLRLYYKMNEGSGRLVYDYGLASNVSTDTLRTVGMMVPSAPAWSTGLVHGGLGDNCISLDGADDYAVIPSFSDEYAVMRTGLSDWTYQMLYEPTTDVQDGGVLFQFGTNSFTTGTNGYALALETSVDDSIPAARFRARLCFATETAEITWSTSFTGGNRYGLTVQKLDDGSGEYKVLFRVDDLTNRVDGGYVTATVADGSGPGFGAGIFPVIGAAYPGANTTPVSGFLRGKVDEVRIWSGARYEPLSDHYGDVWDPSLLGYWKFNEGSGVVAKDSSSNEVDALVLPVSGGPTWVDGFVDPIEGHPVTGIAYFETDKLANKRRALLASSGNTIWRSEGVTWKPLVTARSKGFLDSSGQLGDQMLIVNGEDENLLYDGERIWPAGLESPSDGATASVYALTNQGPWIKPPEYSTTAASFISKITTSDPNRTEQGFSFNDKRVFHAMNGYTMTTRCRYYFRDRTWPLLSIFWRDTTRYEVLGAFSTWNLPAGSFEGMRITAGGFNVGTETITIIQDEILNNNPNYRRWSLATNFDFGTWGTSFDNNIPRSARADGQFVYYTAFTDTVYNTTTYDISLYDGGITGPFYYRYTHYNRYTGEESNPSPPTDEVVSPVDQAVRVTVGTVTYTNVTDRFIYRTKYQGARDGDGYFLLGTMTGTAFGTFGDLTPSGLEGRLISFYRSRPPKSSVVKVFKNRVWYVPVDEPNLLYFSTPNRPTEVDEFNYLIFGDASDRIVALGIQQDSLVVFKRHSVWLVTRSDIPGGMRPYRLSDSVGCVSHHSVVEAEGEIFWLADGGVYSLSGSQIRRVSESKTQWFFDRLDPDLISKAVGANLAESGVYRINIPPQATYATTVRSGVNSWMLDFHYARSRNHIPYYEPVWSEGDREVSCYGHFVTEQGRRFVAYGDYRGFVYVDDVPEAYTDGLGWYRQSVPTSAAAVFGTATSAGFTVTVDTVMFTGGSGLKGVSARFFDGSGGEESHIIESSTEVPDGTSIVLQTALSSSYSTGASVYFAPVISQYRSGWIDFGRTARDKKVTHLKLDHRLESSASTMTIYVNTGRADDGSARAFSTDSVPLNRINELISTRGRGRHVRVELYHGVPGQTFQVYKLEPLITVGRAKGDA